MKIQIKRWDNEQVIFEHEQEGNTIKITVELAVKQGVILSFADLRSANLRSANLYSANLRSANLYSANLRSADLRSANLYSANLRLADLESADLESADLYSANLESANLRSANLRSANLESANLRSANLPIYCKWSHSIINNNIQIGCKTKSIEEWDYFFNEECDIEYSTPRDSEDFKRIKAVYMAYKAYLTTLNN
jgi:uncharacterized protein YjbI with pentapeptide repeats